MSTELKDAQDEIAFLEAALKCYQGWLNTLIGACIGPDGKPVAPPQRTLMALRGHLPSKFSQSLTPQANTKTGSVDTNTEPASDWLKICSNCRTVTTCHELGCGQAQIGSGK